MSSLLARWFAETLYVRIDGATVSVRDARSGKQLKEPALVRKLLGNRWFSPSPFMVMHLTQPLEGGLTQIEIRALKELGMGAGASTSLVWEGPALTDGQVLAREFPATGEVLE